MTTAAILVAAGRGRRAGGGTPKQWRSLGGVSVIGQTVARFEQAPEIKRIVIVLHPDELHLGAEFESAGHILAAGGATRADSVRSGLRALRDIGPARVLIHDVARPCVSQALISAVISALETDPGAAPAVQVTDALWTGAQGYVTGALPRDGLFRAQTPQGFRYTDICAAHATFDGDAADDVQVALASGMKVAIVPGDEDNLKITKPDDFARAERILRTQSGY